MMNSLSPLRLIQFQAGYNLPVHVAMESGHFARQGLDVQTTYTLGSVDLMEALEAGRFEVGHTAADDLVARVQARKGNASDLFLFMGIYGGLLALVGSPESPNFHSLRGKPLGVDAKTNGFVLLLEKKLRSMGFGASDYSLIEVGGWEQRYRALLEGRLAATLLTPPFVGDAVEAGCHILARLDDVEPVYQATCGVSRRSWARENGDVLVRYIRSYLKATRWCYDPDNRQGCLDLLVKHHGIKLSSAEKTLDALLDPERGLYPNAELSIPGIAAVIRLRAEMGYIAPPLPAPEEFVDLSYYRSAVQNANASPGL